MSDHLAAWCGIRDLAPWADVRHGLGWPVEPVQGERDGIAHRIATVEHARDPARAQRLLSAYGQMQDDAALDKILEFHLLASWQRAVLGVGNAPFRDSPAFAKDGRERYGLDSDTPAPLREMLGSQLRKRVAGRGTGCPCLPRCVFLPSVRRRQCAIGVAGFGFRPGQGRHRA